MKLRRYIPLGVVLVATALLWFNWNSWFGDLPEPDFQLSYSPERLFITTGEEGLRDRSFSWVSEGERPFTFTLVKDSLGHRYDPSHEAITTGGGTTHIYNVRLNNLSEGTYRYYISSEDASDTIWGDFKIYPDDGDINLIFIGDVQDKGESGSRAFFQEIHRRFPDMDGWLLVGDMIERPHNQWWDFFYHSMDGIAPSTAFIPTPGNHEYELGGLGSLGKRFVSTFPMPLNGNKSTNYFVDYPTVRIIALETNNLLWNLSESRKWLEQSIEENPTPFVIVMGHHGVFSVRKWRINPVMRYGIKPVLEEHQVDLMLQGHDHAYSRDGTPPDRPIYITMSSSAKHYPVGNPSNHTVSDSGQRYYSHIRITHDTLYFNTYREDHSLLDSFELPRKT